MTITRRAVLSAGAGTALLAVPSAALARTSAPRARQVRLRPNGHDSLTFGLGSSSAWRAVISVRSERNSAVPFVRAAIGGELVALAGSPEAGGQVYAGGGKGGGPLKVSLSSEDSEYPLTVGVSVTGAPSPGLSWRQATARQNGCWLEAGSSDFARGLLLSGESAAIEPGDQVLFYVPMNAGKFRTTVTGPHSGASAILVNLDPAVTGYLWQGTAERGRSAAATLALPPSPCGLSVTNSGSSRSAYRVRVARA